MIRRYNSVNDATNPSDVIDDALKSFNRLRNNQRFNTINCHFKFLIC